MKSNKLKKILETVLRWMAITVLKKYKPTVVGITGSMGKTSAKEAIYCVLSEKLSVRKNEKNYNNEIGIPLTIIGVESGYRSLGKWAKVFLKWLRLVIWKTDYPQILILEMGVDAPGDMKYLLDFIPVKIGVVTAIASVHLEHFKSLDHIAREKGKIIEALPEDGLAILNSDDEKVLALQEKTKVKKILYGFGNLAEVKASDVIYAVENNQPAGLSFKLNYAGKSIPIRLKHILAPHQIYAALAAISAGINFKINLLDIAAALEKFTTPCGRVNLIAGINGSSIIDDTYNASPKATISALEVLSKIDSSRKIVALGDMLELGIDEERGHTEVARKIFEVNADLFFAVGERMRITIKELKRLGYPEEKIFWFDNPSSCGDKLREVLKSGDLALVKGSQSMRMEKVVEKIMDSPEKARDILCRQTKGWWKKPYIKP